MKTPKRRCRAHSAGLLSRAPRPTAERCLSRRGPRLASVSGPGAPSAACDGGAQGHPAVHPSAGRPRPGRPYIGARIPALGTSGRRCLASWDTLRFSHILDVTDSQNLRGGAPPHRTVRGAHSDAGTTSPGTSRQGVPLSGGTWGGALSPARHRCAPVDLTSNADPGAPLGTPATPPLCPPCRGNRQCQGASLFLKLESAIAACPIEVVPFSSAATDNFKARALTLGTTPPHPPPFSAQAAPTRPAGHCSSATDGPHTLLRGGSSPHPPPTSGRHAE